ncbi:MULTISPECIES: TrmH family RNA methyltransferase [unclassified Corynebacterium]|uniref:TrmH family RNA methyltransferase n=1 Tax=unclassified Corynebacterium TaxID=2624378 RepID=UPI003524630F
MLRIPVTSPDDSRLLDYRDLNHSDNRPDLPGGKGLVIAEGALVVGRLLASRFPVRSIVGFGHRLDEFLADPEVVRAVSARGIPIYEVERRTLAETVGFDMHRGLLAAADRVPGMSVTEAVDGARTIAVLEGVGDHENIGSLFRNAAGLGVDAILFGAGCADPLYRRVVRVSMGHVLRTPFAHFSGTPTTWQRGLEDLRADGFTLLSLTPDPAAEHLADAVTGADGYPVNRLALLVGAEGPGLSEHAMRATDVRARIPMASGTDSLNLATAAAIAFYERQRSLR